MAVKQVEKDEVTKTNIHKGQKETNKQLDRETNKGRKTKAIRETNRDRKTKWERQGDRQR